MNLYIVKLGIYSEKYSAEEINTILAINYDHCWVKGMPRSKRSNVMKFEQHAWFIVSETSNQVPIDSQINEIFKRIEASIDKFAQLYNDCSIYFNCSIEGDENPELHFPKEIIQKISTIQANLDVDIFTAK
jgi:hypothetical protein